MVYVTAVVNGSTVMMYTDNTTLYHSCVGAGDLQQILTTDLLNIAAWVKQNHLQIIYITHTCKVYDVTIRVSSAGQDTGFKLQQLCWANQEMGNAISIGTVKLHKPHMPQ